MSEASPRLPSHRKTNRRCLLTRIEYHPPRLPSSFSKGLLGGTRRSWSVTVSSMIWSLRKRRTSKSDGIIQEVTSMTKKAHSQSSRKFTIIRYLENTYVPLNSTIIKLDFALLLKSDSTGANYEQPTVVMNEALCLGTAIFGLCDFTHLAQIRSVNVSTSRCSMSFERNKTMINTVSLVASASISLFLSVASWVTLTISIL